MTSTATHFHRQLLLQKLNKFKQAKTPLEKGFTLVELLVVLIIIAILVSLAIQNFTGVIDTAASTAARTWVTQEAKLCTASLIDGNVTYTASALPDKVTAAAGNSCANNGTIAATGGGTTWTVTFDGNGFPGPAVSTP